MASFFSSMSNPKPKVVNFACLEKVRLDSMEAKTLRCNICKQRLDRSEGVEECDEQQLVITRLPCSCPHLYHGDCIVKYSEKNQLCPSCLIPMPTIEEDEAVAQDGELSKPPGWRRLNWPMVFAVSTGGILTAMVACRLWKLIR